MRPDASPASGIPLLCFPHAGAGRLYYTRWRSHFSDGIRFEVVQYPEREHRRAHRMPATVQRLAADIHAEYEDLLSGPYAIWGHSMGSVVGYEVAKRCRQLTGNGPVVFFSSGSSAPCDSRFKSVPSLSTPGGFREILQRYGGIAPEYLEDRDFMDYFAPIIKADLALLGGYEDDEQVPLDCPLVLMEGRDDNVRIDNWSRYAARAPELHLFDGGHFFPDQHQSALANLMTTRIQLAWQMAGARR